MQVEGSFAMRVVPCLSQTQQLPEGIAGLLRKTEQYGLDLTRELTAGDESTGGAPRQADQGEEGHEQRGLVSPGSSGVA
eukprot:683142-Rhodomonas_salina.12